MEDFMQQRLPWHQLEKLNACRMFLQVTTLAEITNHTGNELLPQILLPTAQTAPKGLVNISTLMLQWPTIHKPSTTCWRLWTNTLGTIYTGDKHGTRLCYPLGEWLPEHATHCFWHWRMYDPDHMVYRNSPPTPTRVSIPIHRR